MNPQPDKPTLHELEQQVLKLTTAAYGDGKAQAILGKIQSLKPTVRVSLCESLVADLTNNVTDIGTVKFKNTKELTNKVQPVSAETFLMDPYFLGKKEEVFPRVLEHYIEINSGKYDEAVLTGAIGTAKTTLALWTNAYQLYKLSLYKNPQAAFGIERNTEILFIFQSITGALAKSVDFERFKALIHQSHYFTEEFRYNPEINSELQFPNRIVVKPVSGDQTGAIGQNVFGGLIDEVNYMAKIEKSKQSDDGGDYDQAVALYNTIVRRRKSRFMKLGKVPGVFCIVSSKRYPGQFTDVKAAEMRREIAKYGKSSIYLYDKRTWDVLPEDNFTGKWFDIFIGDDSRRPRILQEDEKIHADDRHLVDSIPLEYREDFENDIMDALREIGGISTRARFPFFTNVEAVSKAFGRSESVLDKTSVDFHKEPIRRLPKKIIHMGHPKWDRWVHIDLALTGDSAGIACGHISKFVKVIRGDSVEVLPEIYIDFTLRVMPPQGGEIEFENIRRVIYSLHEVGLPIKYISFDSYQSRDSIQILRGKGYECGLISMDKDTSGYDLLKQAVYDGRMWIPTDPFAKMEMVSLERDLEKGKIDHPPGGTKDVADALAGVVRGLSGRTILWAEHGISLRQIPASITQLVIKTNSRAGREAMIE